MTATTEASTGTWAASADRIAAVRASLDAVLHEAWNPAHLLPGTQLGAEQWRQNYREAYALFSAGGYAPALPLLVALLSHAPMVAACHFMVAACQHRLGRHRDAVQAYLTAYALDVDDPVPLFHCADCLQRLGKPAEARMALQRFLATANPEAHTMQISQSRAMLRTLRGLSSPSTS